MDADRDSLLSDDSSPFFLDIDIYGYSYSPELANSVRDALSTTKSIVRGSRIPACAPPLVIDFIISVAKDVAVGIIVRMLFDVMKQAWDASLPHLKDGFKLPIIGKTVIRTLRTDYVIFHTKSYSDQEVESIIAEMKMLTTEEELIGRNVRAVYCPVEHGSDGIFRCGKTIAGTDDRYWIVEYDENAEVVTRVFDREKVAFLNDAHAKIHTEIA